MTRPFRSVFFDFGGTLFSYRVLGDGNAKLVHQAAQRLGVDLPPAKVGRAFQKASGHTFSEFTKRPYYLHRDVFLETFRRFAERLDAEATPDFLDWFYDEQKRRFVDNVRLRDDCLETLRALRDDGLTVMVVSNIDDDFLHPMIDRCGLDAELDEWWSSEQAGSCKPDAGFFRFALKRAGRRPEEVLFVGDSPEHDIAGARAVGMTTALIHDEGVEPPGAGLLPGREPHHRITALSQLLPLVRG